MKVAAVSAKRRRHLLTPQGTPGIELELVPDTNAAATLRSGLAAVHGPIDSAVLARAADLAVAVVTESGVLLGENGRVSLRAWTKRNLVRIELSGRTPRARWSALDLVASRATGWGLVDGGRVLWFEVE